MNKTAQRSILHLNLHREFFAQIAGGTKRVEYRDSTPYWRTRLEGRQYDLIRFRNGYASNAPEMLVEFRDVRKTRKNARQAYAIRLGRVMRVIRWRP